MRKSLYEKASSDVRVNFCHCSVCVCVCGGEVRQKDCEFEAKMDYEVRPIQKKFKKKKEEGGILFLSGKV